jgi:hypothetical protein
LSPWHQEIFDLFRGPKLFTIVCSEAEARRDVRRGLSDLETLRFQNSLRPPHPEWIRIEASVRT